MKKKIYFLLSVLFLGMVSCRTFPDKEIKAERENHNSKLETLIRGTENSFPIRVKIVVGERVSISAVSSLCFQDLITGRDILTEYSGEIVVKNGEKGTSLLFFSEKEKCRIERTLVSPVVVKAKNRNFVEIDGRWFPGEIRIYPFAKGFELVNDIPIETYLVSVLSSEMPSSFEMEALKAQAIIARTYALYHMMYPRKERSYDVDNTTSFQVYHGFKDIIENRNFFRVFRAVKETAGKVVTYEEKPILAYFHANSGGKLVSGGKYFGRGSDFPYLMEKEDPFSAGMPGYLWEYRISREEFFQKLRVEPEAEFQMITFEDGLLEQLFFPNEGKGIENKEIRKRIGYAKVKSEKFQLSMEKPSTGKEGVFLFQGMGYGHGVGMSQWGAEGMARQGFNYPDIIRFYYPETEIRGY